MSKFKIGDKVKVTTKITREEGFANSWNSSEMDCYVNNGTTYTIIKILSDGIRFKENQRFGWPHGSLSLIETIVPDGLTPIQRRCKKLWNQSNYVKQNPQRAY